MLSLDLHERAELVFLGDDKEVGVSVVVDYEFDRVSIALVEYVTLEGGFGVEWEGLWFFFHFLKDLSDYGLGFIFGLV